MIRLIYIYIYIHSRCYLHFHLLQNGNYWKKEKKQIKCFVWVILLHVIYLWPDFLMREITVFRISLICLCILFSFFQWKTRTASFDSQGSCPSPKAPASPWAEPHVTQKARHPFPFSPPTKNETKLKQKKQQPSCFQAFLLQGLPSVDPRSSVCLMSLEWDWLRSRISG